jgi:hypothetical protein
MSKNYYGIASCDKCGKEIERIDLWDINGTHLGYPEDWWPDDLCDSEECQKALAAEEEAEANRFELLTAEKAEELLHELSSSEIGDDIYTHIDVDAAAILLRCEKLNRDESTISLRGLKEITADVARLFSGYKGKRLNFGKKFTCTHEVAQILSDCECELWFAWEMLPDEDEERESPVIAEALAQHKGGMGMSLTFITDGEAEQLSNYKGKWLALGDCGERLDMSEMAAEQLAKTPYKFERLILHLDTIDEECREILKNRPGCWS